MASRSGPDPQRPAPGDGPWVFEGIIAGIIGAAVIAVVFFAIDVANERPLWTPHALGTALFLGRLAPQDAAVSPALISAYTLLHGLAFVGVALIVAVWLTGNRLPGQQRWMRILVLALPLFVGFSVIIFVTYLLRGADAARSIGVGWLVFSNAIAAVMMAASLVMRLNRGDD